MRFRGLRKISTAEPLWLRNSLFESKDLANLVNPHTHVLYSTVRSRYPPRSTFGAKYSFPGVTENQNSRTAWAAKFSVRIEKKENLVSPDTNVASWTVRSRNPPRSTFGAKHSFLGVTEIQCSGTALASKFSIAMERFRKFSISPNPNVAYSTVRPRNPPSSTFGAKHSFPGVTENQYSRTVFRLRNSLFE